MTTGKMRGKKIWLVGASEGIGKRLAQALAHEGAILAVSARQQDKLQMLVDSFPGSGHGMVPLDVQDISSVAFAYESLKANWGVPDVVIYNAGTYDPVYAQTFGLPRIQKMMDVNFNGALRVLNYILPDFILNNKGHIALVGSIAGYRGLPGAIGYGASKAALMHLAENLAVDLYKTNIKVQIINPGFVKTKLTAKNTFAMPQIMEAEEAAMHIVRGLESQKFEIRFPWAFSTLLKMLSFLPAALYFRIMREKKRDI
ncbi:MAG: SDR family NAD(P)-dependent oxidoreductase [Chitinophagia bacterium]|nr:SDR family NAD(P)-dependent oxidoreductase [Chitinophagia bacterium]